MTRRTEGPVAVVSASTPDANSGQGRAIHRLFDDAPGVPPVLLGPPPASDDGPFYTAEGYNVDMEGLAGAAVKLNLTLGVAKRVLARADFIERRLREVGAGLVLVCSGDPLDIPAAFIAATRLDLPFVVYAFDDPVHQWEDETLQATNLLAERLWAPRADLIIAPNSTLAHDINVRNEGSGSIISEVIYNPVPANTRVARSLRHLKLNTPTKILYTGSVYHAQADALRNLIAAIDRLDGEFVLEILSFQDKASLEAQGISGPHVRYASGVSAEDALKAQIDADILFLPLSFTRIQKVVRSSSPLKLGEYLFSGRPVLVHAPAESWVASFFRENKCGAVVDRDDIDELTATLMRLRDDAQWRWQLNQGQRAIAPEFSLARNRDRLWSLLERCRTRRANTPPISFPRYQGDGQPAAALPGREREAVPHAPASPSRLPALPARVLDAEGPRRPLILFVAMQNSPHTARWIEMVADRGWDLRLFPLDPHGVNANLCGVTLYQPQLMAIRPEDYKELPLPAYAKGRTTPVQVVPYRAGLRDIGGVESLQSGRVSLGEAGETAPALHGPGVLASLIRKLQPDLIHSMEFQHAGYLVSQAKDLYGDGFPPWLATNWGSDIFHFAQFEAHQKQIEHLLSQIDYYSCECHRDIKLAHHHGFRGPVMRVLPNTGGFDIEHITTLRSPLPPSKRKRIMIKGYQHFAGRAMTSLAVLESIADRLKDYEIILYSVSSEPLARASQLIDQGVLNIKIVGWADHDEMLSYFGSSRMYMGISVSDAISTSVLEAMAMGAFPIQTDTSCCDEWFEDGIGGFIVSPDAVDQIRTAFLRALDDDALVDSAAEINWKTVERRLDRRILAPQIAEFYKPIFDDLRLFRNQRVEP